MGLINSWRAHSHWVPLSADISGVACTDMWSCGSVCFHNQAKGNCSVIQPYGQPYDILTGRLYVDTKGCSTDSVIVVSTDLPFLHTHIRQ